MADYPFLKSKIAITGTIEARSGLLIGAGEVGLAIGGLDKFVIRSPRNGEPYIPGSSLKGKMRSLLEKAGYAKALSIKKEGDTWKANPCSCARSDCPVCVIFGVAADKQAQSEASLNSRLIVRDGHLENGEEIEKWHYLDMHYTEAKTEVSIDRLTAKATPRTFERVPAGAKFGLDMVLNIYEGDDESKNVKVILDALELLAADYLGGQGTRGYGAVKVTIDRLQKLDISRLKNGTDEKDAWHEASYDGITLPWVRPR